MYKKKYTLDYCEQMFYAIGNKTNDIGGIIMKNTLFMAALATSLAIPVAVAPMAQAQEKPVFTDVPKSHPNFEVIHKMRDQGIINGYPDGTFRPNVEVKRSHVAALLARALPLKPVRAAKDFTDVPKNHEYYEVIQQVQRAGIMDGLSGKFNPDATLTRAQMAKVLTLAFDLKVKATYDFADVDAKHWSNEYVRALYSNGITTGSGKKGYYLPDEKVSRVHYAVFLHRLLNMDPHFEAKPIPKPEEKPPVQEKPEEKPVKPHPTGLPKVDDLVAPKGWTKEKVTEHFATFDDILKNAPVRKGSNGTGSAYLTSNSLIEMYFEEERLQRRVNGFNARGATLTTEEFKQIVLGVIESGELYVDSSGVFALFFDYETKRLHNVIVSIR